jgi:acyl-CoA thioesterase-1
MGSVIVRVLLAGLLFAAAPAGARSADDTAPALLVLGDSLSAGYGIALDKGWVNLLQGRIEREGLPHRVVNASISGDTTAGGLARLPELLKDHRPAVVLIELGANDGLRGFSPTRIADALDQLVQISREAGSEVVLAGVRLPPNYGEAFSDRFQRIYQDVARRNDVALVPQLLLGVAEDFGLMQPDGLHPTAEAQARILENVWPVLMPLLQETAASRTAS